MTANSATPSTRDRIISEASRLFAANGIKATTVAQIEIAVGLRKGSGGVHRYFATKDDLVDAVLQGQLVGAHETLASTQQTLPLPDPESIGPYLRALGNMVLSESEKSREVAMIMLRDANALGERLDEQRRHNDALAYGMLANAVREIQELVGDQLGIDADAYGYVFTSPLIYFKLIEWASGRRPLEIEYEALVDTWATTMEPTYRLLVEARQKAGLQQSGPTRQPTKRTGHKNAR